MANIKPKKYTQKIISLTGPNNDGLIYYHYTTKSLKEFLNKNFSTHYSDNKNFNPKLRWRNYTNKMNHPTTVMKNISVKLLHNFFDEYHFLVFRKFIFDHEKELPTIEANIVEQLHLLNIKYDSYNIQIHEINGTKTMIHSNIIPIVVNVINEDEEQQIVPIKKHLNIYVSLNPNKMIDITNHNITIHLNNSDILITI